MSNINKKLFKRLHLNHAYGQLIALIFVPIAVLACVGAMLVIGLYALLIWRGLKIARNAPDQLGSLLAFGLTSWIVIEAMINVWVIVGLLPFAGNALPFISAGGSSMVTSLAAVGIIMNVARQGLSGAASERSNTSATVDLRRRDWRRSVSGADRYGETE